ncbi:BnaC03g35420D [Brassica napus]|uniref:BnaC03g35420D protein n=1 Tax=Brassica napus TaxID=3708 RepID=A0A078F3M8_BRANA|nr:BnaC03g35420D [Brassica napus]
MIVNGWFLQDMSYKDQSILYEPIKELDVMLNQTVLVDAGVSVDIISGVNDPVTLDYLSSHRSVAFSLDQHLITPSDHVEIFTHLMWIISDFLELMVRKSMTFTSGDILLPLHLNTLNCYPFIDGDSFVIETCPHVINITTVW